jgi:hypothetical protein
MATKSELLCQVDFLLATYSKILIVCGIDVTKYNQEFDRRTVPQIKEGLQWLEARSEVVDQYRRIRALLSEEIWNQYKHMDTEDFREVKLLNEAIAKIKKSFVGRPALFINVKDAGKCRRSQTTEA